MTMHKVLHPRVDVDRLYVSRKEGGRGLVSIEYSIDTSIQRLEDCIEKYEEELITSVRNDTDNTMANRMTITRKQKRKEKQFYELRINFFYYLLQTFVLTLVVFLLFLLTTFRPNFTSGLLQVINRD